MPTTPLIIAQYMAAAAFFTVAVMHALVWSRRGSMAVPSLDWRNAGGAWAIIRP